mmetsp:Transcript_33460/g.80017  ORF Transcript_33460/g.80017 Transcript_33460/m.80017 type:complete len:210 (+) Transcript_33460:628-1257(+)
MITRITSRSALGFNNPALTSFSNASSQSVLPMIMQKMDRLASVFIRWDKARARRVSSSLESPLESLLVADKSEISSPGSFPSSFPHNLASCCSFPLHRAPPIHQRPFVSASSKSRRVTRRHDPLFLPDICCDAAVLMRPMHFLIWEVFSRMTMSCFRCLLFFSSIIDSTMNCTLDESIQSFPTLLALSLTSKIMSFRADGSSDRSCWPQ